ncbi:MAG: response regulator transcription factor [Stenotrophomonas sp.]
MSDATVAAEWSPRHSALTTLPRMNGFPAPRRLRLALLDDHDVVRRGTAFHLGNDVRFEIVASHSDSLAFVLALQQCHADVAIIDITLAPTDISGTALVRHLRKALPRVTLLGFAGQNSVATINHLLDAGISGFVGKSEPLAELSDAVVRVSQGLCRIPPSCKLLAPCDALSRNEREVIQLVLDGLTVSEIALHRHRSVKTVSTQKVAALRKLGLRNDAEIFAMRQQLETL